MNKYITYRLVGDVRKSNGQSLHDQAWHEFQNEARVEAVNYALRFKSNGDKIGDIVRLAKKYASTEMEG